VVDAINRASPPPSVNQTCVRYAYLQYDMKDGSRLVSPGSESDSLGKTISEAAFGLRNPPDMQFPMRGITSAKQLLSLFAPLGGRSGTCVYTRTSELTTENGHIMAGTVRLQDHIEQRWWLPPSALLPWKQDLPNDRHGGTAANGPSTSR
jgi:hypothetical protein